jgi:hypothetical protein
MAGHRNKDQPKGCAPQQRRNNKCWKPQQNQANRRDTAAKTSQKAGQHKKEQHKGGTPQQRPATRLHTAS